METIFPALEYSASLISQREVGKHAHHFEEAIASLSNQSLNAVFLGDIRNYEMARSALSLAQSGFLVLGNLQCQNVQSSIDKMIDFFPGTEQTKARFALASQYRLGIAQTLAPGIDENLRLAVEVMKLCPDIKAYITQTQKDDRKFSVTEIIEKFSDSLGTQSLDQSLAHYFVNKEITEDTLMEYSPDPEAVIVRQELLKIKLSSKWDPAGATIEKAFGRQLVLVPLQDSKE
jgi:twitching motility protein PilT